MKRFTVLLMGTGGLVAQSSDRDLDEVRDMVEEWTKDDPDGPSTPVDWQAVKIAGEPLPVLSLAPGHPRWALVVEEAS